MLINQMGLSGKIERGLSGSSLIDFTRKLVVYGCLYSRASSTLTATPYWLIASRYHRFRHRRDLRKYNADIDPFAYQWVDPEDINRFTGREGSIRDLRYVGRVFGGDWDKKLPDQSSTDPLRRRENFFEDHLVYQSFQEHFEEGIQWEETDLVRFALKEIEAGRRCWGSESTEDVFERCERMDTLYEAIEENGYRTKRELLGIHPGRYMCHLDQSVDRYGDVDHPTRTGHNVVRGFRGIIGNEILVDIGRDGELLFVDGRHRLSIAKLLGIDTIPVIVMVRHQGWLENFEITEGTTDLTS